MRFIKSLKRANFSQILTLAGYTLIASSSLLLIFVYKGTVTNEVKYYLTRGTPQPQPEQIQPYNWDFSIVIPKIGANSPIIANVDPYDSAIYQQELRNGVAHAKDTATPDQEGHTFLFAHSSTNFYEANRYNSVFYLLRKLQNDDTFYIAYQGKLYKYAVTGSEIVTPENVQYLNNLSTPTSAPNTVTLMTCWPPGTTKERLLVFGEQR
jgi:LPXTG-site transpeptidase (sortase) family protein